MNLRRPHTRKCGARYVEQLLSVDDGLDKRKAFIYQKMK